MLFLHVVISTFLALPLHGQQQSWQKIYETVPDPRSDFHSCGLTMRTTEYLICDPEQALNSETQKRISDSLQTLQATRYHECIDGTTPPIKLSIMFGSSNFASDIAIPKLDFAEELVELILEKASSNGKSVERSCGSNIAALIATTSCPPILTIRGDRAKEPLLPEKEYPATYKTLIQKLQLNETCSSRSLNPFLPSPTLQEAHQNLTKNERFDLMFQQQFQSTNASGETSAPGQAALDVAADQIIDFITTRFPKRATPLPVPPAQEKVETVVKEKIEELPARVVRGQAAAEQTLAMKEAPKERITTAPSIVPPVIPPIIHIWKYLIPAGICVVVYASAMEILRQILKRRIGNYAGPYSSSTDVNVDVLALATDADWHAESTIRETRKGRRPTTEDNNVFGSRGRPTNQGRSISQPPPSS